MNVNGNTKSPDEWYVKLLPLLSALFGAAALWYAWYEYAESANESTTFPWYGWIRFGIIVAFGVLCVIATLLFLTGRPSAKSVFTLGLGMIPVLLLTNLAVLAVGVAARILSGDAWPTIEKIAANPRTWIVPVIIAALVLLSKLSNKEQSTK